MRIFSQRECTCSKPPHTKHSVITTTAATEIICWSNKESQRLFLCSLSQTTKISIWALIFKTSWRHIQVKTEYSADTSGLDAQITIATDNALLEHCCTSEDCLHFQIPINAKTFFSVTHDPAHWLQVGCDTESGVELGTRSPRRTAISGTPGSRAESESVPQCPHSRLPMSRSRLCRAQASAIAGISSAQQKRHCRCTIRSTAS